MNRTFKVIWNVSRQVWMVTGELTRGKSKSSTAASASKFIPTLSSALLATGLSAIALPAWSVDTSRTGASGDWFTTDNWDTNAVPTSSDNTFIDNDGAAQVSSGTAQARDLSVGFSGNGTLDITNGGAVSNTFGFIGRNSGSSISSVTVDGVGSSWTNSGNLSVGHSGDGTLNVSDGGTVSNNRGFIGFGLGSTSRATVDGAGSSWTNSDSLYVGDSGNGTLEITNGGAVSNTVGYIGHKLDGISSATVDGADSTWANSDRLYVGDVGEGTLDITNGGAVSNTVGYIGYNTVSKGWVTVDGAGSSWTNSDDLYVGDLGDAALAISNGGAVSNTFGYIGRQSGSTGNVTVDGASSSWTNSSRLYVGSSGDGTLDIANGGAVSNTFGYIGYDSGSTGSVTVDGTGSSWANSSELIVGELANGTLEITNGGAVSNTNGFIGYNSGSTGSVTVDGSGSSWTNSDDLFVGSSGDGALDISNGGTVNVNSGTGTVSIGGSPGSTGTLNIGAASGDTAVAAGTLSAASVSFAAGTGALAFNHTETDYTFSPTISGAGSIGLLSGSTRFTGALTGYTGTLTVDGGTLAIQSGETLSLGGNYTQAASGVISLGVTNTASFGKLIVAGTATLASNAQINVDVAGLSTPPSLTNVILAGTLTSDGSFVVTDNSLLFNFDAVKDGNTVDLTLASAATAQSLTTKRSTLGAAATIDSIISTNPTGEIASSLISLTTVQEVTDAVESLLPGNSSGMAQTTNISTNAVTGIVASRQDLTRGLSSGDDFITDRHIWVKPFGGWAEQDTRQGVTGYDVDSYGLALGMDRDVSSSWNAGLALAYINSDVASTLAAGAQSVDIDTYLAKVYATNMLDATTALNLQAGLGFSNYDSNRRIFTGDVASAGYDSWNVQLSAELERSYQVSDKTVMTPYVHADYGYTNVDGYTESGAGALSLNVANDSADSLIIGTGVKANHTVSDSLLLMANAGIGYDVMTDRTSLTSSFAGGGAQFTTEGIEPDEWVYNAGLGAKYILDNGAEITASYNIDARQDFTDQSVSVNFRMMF
ncbi:autotransporter domain-containing protein [Neptunomonas antarctica]|nr:autotransporter domain-containing protein [Neptunomonas antarctica]